MTFYRRVLLGSAALVLTACSSDDEPAGQTPTLNESCVADADCDESLRPFVFIHGTFGSATEVSNIAQLLGSNGYCQKRFVAVEYDSLGGSPLNQLIALVDQALADTGFDQVDLAGHSQGTGHACAYLADATRAAKVAHYINFSGGCAGAGVPTLSISSENDLRGGAIHPSGPNVTQITHADEDHVAIAGSKNSFIEVYKYLMGKEPTHTTVQCGQNPVTADGKVVTFGDNVPRAGAKVDVFEIDALANSPRERGAPVMTLTADAEGHISAQLKRDVLYEFKVSDADGTQLGYAYPPPFKRSNYLLRLLTPSTNPLVADSTTNRVTRGPNHAGFVFRYVAGAFRPDWNNTLKIDGQEILTAENSPRNASRVGLFAYDANESGASDLGLVFTTSFIGATDVFVPASPPRWVQIDWTNEEGRSIVMKVPNWPSSESLASINLPYP